MLFRPDGNGGTNLPVKPHIARISVIVTVAIFIITVVFTAGGKSGNIKNNTGDILENRKSIVEVNQKLDKELSEIKPILNAVNTKMDLLLKDAKIIMNQDKP